MCWFYMGIAQIALDPPPLSKGQTWKKVCQTILANMGKEVLQTIWQALREPVKNVLAEFVR